MTSYRLEKDLVEFADFHVPTLNKQLKTTINRVIFAIDREVSLDGEFRATIRFLLKSFLTTHESIIAILRFGNEEKFDEQPDKKAVLIHGPDAMSLVREQIEKVFTITLLLADPPRWHAAYLRDDWKRLYEHLLHQRDETSNLERFRGFYSEFAPNLLEKSRIRLGITDKQVKAIEFKYYNHGVELPPDLKGALIHPFPTPGRVHTLLLDTEKEPFLKRLYKEYKFISGYTHVGPLKLDLLAMSDRIFRKQFKESDQERYFENEVLGSSLIVSFLSAAVAASEASSLFATDVDVLAALTEQWETLKKGSLLAMALWDLQGALILPKDVL